MITQFQYKIRQALDLETKELYAMQRIRQFYNRFYGKVYISFSGGRDSTVLLHLVRREYPNVKGVFINTGNEFPEIIQFVKTKKNIEWIRPKMNIKRVIEKYGYPVISKEQAQYINEAKTTKSKKLYNKRVYGDGSGSGMISNKYMYMLKSDFNITAKCCDILKKNPIKQFEKKSGLYGFIGTMADNSRLRKQAYIRKGCNNYDNKRPLSRPLSIFTESDIKNYIKNYDLSVSEIYKKGYNNTGCMICMFGDAKKMQKLYETHPKIWNYAVNKLGYNKVCEYMRISTKPEKTLFD